MKTTTALCFLLITSLLFTQETNATVSCGVVASKAVACISFVTGKVPRPTQPCCAGLQQLAKGATTVANRRGICQCLKNGVKVFPRVQDRFLGKILGACGIKVGFPVSLNTNCNKIN